MTSAFREAQVCACGDHGFVGLTRGLVAFVDADDTPAIAGRLWRYLSAAGVVYARTDADVLMHRVIAAPASGEYVDHRDHDGLNNRRDNLRRCSSSQNLGNRRGNRQKTLPKGVYAEGSRFRAKLMVAGKRHNLGTFATAEDAAAAYDEAAIRLRGDFAFTNAMTRGGETASRGREAPQSAPCVPA